MKFFSVMMLLSQLFGSALPAYAVEKSKYDSWLDALFDIEGALAATRRRFSYLVSGDAGKVAECQQLLNRVAELAGVRTSSDQRRLVAIPSAPQAPLPAPSPVNLMPVDPPNQNNAILGESFTMTPGPLDLRLVRWLQTPSDRAARRLYEEAVTSHRWTDPRVKAEIMIGTDWRPRVRVSVARPSQNQPNELEWTPLFISNLGGIGPLLVPRTDAEYFFDPTGLVWRIGIEGSSGVNNLVLSGLETEGASEQRMTNSRVLQSTVLLSASADSLFVRELLSVSLSRVDARPRGFIAQSEDGQSVIYRITRGDVSASLYLTWDSEARQYRMQGFTQNTSAPRTDVNLNNLYGVTGDLLYSQLGLRSLPAIRDMRVAEDRIFPELEPVAYAPREATVSISINSLLTKMLRLSALNATNDTRPQYFADFYDVTTTGTQNAVYRSERTSVMAPASPLATLRRPVMAHSKRLFVTLPEYDSAGTPTRHGSLNVYRANNGTSRIVLVQSLMFNRNDMPLTAMFTDDDNRFVVLMASGEVYFFTVADER